MQPFKGVMHSLGPHLEVAGDDVGQPLHSGRAVPQHQHDAAAGGHQRKLKRLVPPRCGAAVHGGRVLDPRHRLAREADRRDVHEGVQGSEAEHVCSAGAAADGVLEARREVEGSDQGDSQQALWVRGL